MNSYFHFTPILLGPASTIEPGNFGRLIRLLGPAHDLYRREMAYETARQQHFRPVHPGSAACSASRAWKKTELCRAHINGYAGSVESAVETSRRLGGL
jgi:hypothetical protein